MCHVKKKAGGSGTSSATNADKYKEFDVRIPISLIYLRAQQSVFFNIVVLVIV